MSAAFFGLAVALAFLVFSREKKTETPIPFQKEKYTIRDIVHLLRRVTDASDEDIAIGAAIAYAESRGNPKARLDNTKLKPPGKGIDRGLWQINDYWHREVSDAQAYDPIEATRQAWRIKKAQGWREWRTYRPADSSTPPFLAFLPDARTAVEESRGTV